MRVVYDKQRKLMVELKRGVGFGIPVMPQGAFYVFADESKFTDDSYAFAFEFLEKAGVGVAPGVDFGQAEEVFPRELTLDLGRDNGDMSARGRPLDLGHPPSSIGPIPCRVHHPSPSPGASG